MYDPDRCTKRTARMLFFAYCKYIMKGINVHYVLQSYREISHAVSLLDHYPVIGKNMDRKNQAELLHEHNGARLSFINLYGSGRALRGLRNTIVIAVLKVMLLHRDYIMRRVASPVNDIFHVNQRNGYPTHDEKDNN